jgi:hypothetical protein
MILNKGPNWKRDEGSYTVGWLLLIIGILDVVCSALGVLAPLSPGEWVVVSGLILGGGYLVFRHRRI